MNGMVMHTPVILEFFLETELEKNSKRKSFKACNIVVGGSREAHAWFV